MKIRQIFFLLFLFYSFSSTLNAQSSAADSLQLAFNKATSDTARLNILFKDSPFDYLGKPQEMLALYQQGGLIAQRQNDQARLFKSYLYTAMIYIYNLSDEGTGFQYLHKALKVAEIRNDYFDLHRVYYAMAIVQHHQNNRDEMYKYLYKAIEAAEKTDTPELGGFQSLAQNLVDDKRYDDYLAIAKRFVTLVEQANLSADIKLQAYNSIADALKLFPNKKQEFIYYRQKAEILLDSFSTQEYFIREKVIAASIYYKFNRNKRAIELLKQVINKNANDDFHLASQGMAHKLLSEIYESEKNYPLSIEHLKKHQRIENEQLVKRLTEESGKKVIKAEAERDLLLKQKEADNNRWMAILGFSLAVLMLIAGIIVYRFYKREQERKKEVDAINATKDKLFSIIAHDLRSPIGTLKNNLAMTNYGMMSQAEFATVSKRLTSNVNALYQTLDNLLHWAYSQFKGTKVQPETLPLREVANEEILFLAENANQKNISIVNDISQETTTFADRNQISLVIRNLVSNSLKFTHSGGKVVLKTQNIDDSKTTFTITDNGIGMSPELQKQLFSIQNKTSRQGTAEEKGQGLGLLLVKEMVEANHGTLSIESSENKGTVVNIQLPRLKESF